MDVNDSVMLIGVMLKDQSKKKKKSFVLPVLLAVVTFQANSLPCYINRKLLFSLL